MPDPDAFAAIVESLADGKRRQGAAILAREAQILRAAGGGIIAHVLELAAAAAELGIELPDATYCLRVDELFDPPDRAEIVDQAAGLVLRLTVLGHACRRLLPPGADPDFARCAMCGAWLWVPGGSDPAEEARYVCTGDVHSDEAILTHFAASGDVSYGPRNRPGGHAR